MYRNLDGPMADVESALAGGSGQPAGWFRFYFADQRWEWSDQVLRMHGYPPGGVTPTTELVLSHKHPDDRGQVAATIEHILDTREPFSTRHRIVDTEGNVRHVVVVGDRLLGERGEVIGTHGFYIDVTPPAGQAQQAQEDQEDIVTAKLAKISESRAGIEQAKGMLMLVYGISDSMAFDLLTWLSQEANIKLRRLAEQIAEDFRGAGLPAESRVQFDHLLLTAHRRVERPA